MNNIWEYLWTEEEQKNIDPLAPYEIKGGISFSDLEISSILNKLNIGFSVVINNTFKFEISPFGSFLFQDTPSASYKISDVYLEGKQIPHTMEGYIGRIFDVINRGKLKKIIHVPHDKIDDISFKLIVAESDNDFFNKRVYSLFEIIDHMQKRKLHLTKWSLEEIT